MNTGKSEQATVENTIQKKSPKIMLLCISKTLLLALALILSLVFFQEQVISGIIFTLFLLKGVFLQTETAIVQMISSIIVASMAFGLLCSSRNLDKNRHVIDPNEFDKYQDKIKNNADKISLTILFLLIWCAVGLIYNFTYMANKYGFMLINSSPNIESFIFETITSFFFTILSIYIANKIP